MLCPSVLPVVRLFPPAAAHASRLATSRDVAPPPGRRRPKTRRRQAQDQRRGYPTLVDLCLYLGDAGKATMELWSARQVAYLFSLSNVTFARTVGLDTGTRIHWADSAGCVRRYQPNRPRGIRSAVCVIGHCSSVDDLDELCDMTTY